MSIVLLVGIELLYMTVYCVLLPPTAVGCAVTRFIYGTAYTVCYASIFVKINRIVRIFKMAPSIGGKALGTTHATVIRQVVTNCNRRQTVVVMTNCCRLCAHCSSPHSLTFLTARVGAPLFYIVGTHTPQPTTNNFQERVRGEIQSSPHAAPSNSHRRVKHINPLSQLAMISMIVLFQVGAHTFIEWGARSAY